MSLLHECMCADPQCRPTTCKSRTLHGALDRCSYRKATLVTKELAERRAVLQSEGYQAWLQAREQNDWSVFAPKLKELVQARRLWNPEQRPYF